MAASVWSGYLTFGLISMPVRLFSGARSSGISFNMLHRTDKQRVKQQYYCPADNQVVDRSDIVKGYEFRKGEYIVIEPDEIKKIEPKTAKTMEILEFVKTSEVDPVYFESSYYMLPEEAGRRPYALLTKALEESEYVAIAKLTMHNREYTVFLRPHEGGMMLHTMYYEEEVRKVEGFGAPDVELKDAEVKVAHQLIEALADEWDPKKYQDDFQENLKKLIETKLEGGEVAEVEKPKKLAPVIDLMAALKQSLAQTEGKKKPAAASQSTTGASEEGERKQARGSAVARRDRFQAKGPGAKDFSFAPVFLVQNYCYRIQAVLATGVTGVRRNARVEAQNGILHRAIRLGAQESVTGHPAASYWLGSHRRWLRRCSRSLR
jgi:DNA end-binding protein Ku